MAELACIDLGRLSYAPAMRLQQRLAEGLRGGAQEYLRLAEHDPPVITLGISANERNILASAADLRAAGIELHITRRGGDVTYHGPGQLVGYPILRLDRHGRDVRRYVRDLEEVLIRTLRRLGVTGERRQGAPGVWAGAHKVAAVGVAIRRWVTYHGFALNVSPNMKHFDLIVPCGLRPAAVTSMAELLGRPVRLEETKPLIVQDMLEVFGFSASRRIPPEDLPG